MNKEEYKMFLKMYLEKFKGYYERGNMNKKKLKASIYNNPKLLDWQKDDFWKKIGGKINVKSSSVSRKNI